MNLVDVLFHPKPRHEGSPRKVDGTSRYPGGYAAQRAAG